MGQRSWNGKESLGGNYAIKLERYATKIYLYLINLEVSITISTDSLPTTYQQLTDILPTVDRLLADRWLPLWKKLSANCRLRVGRLSVDCRPKLSADSRPTVGRQSVG